MCLSQSTTKGEVGNGTDDFISTQKAAISMKRSADFDTQNYRDGGGSASIMGLYSGYSSDTSAESNCCQQRQKSASMMGMYSGYTSDGTAESYSCLGGSMQQRQQQPFCSPFGDNSGRTVSPSPDPTTVSTSVGNPTHDVDETVKMMNDEMNSMSLNEREKVYEDIHGVAESIQENPEFVANSLDELEKEIHKLKAKYPAYLLAESLSYEYVHGQKLLIMFLRADSWDAPRAANRMLQWFNWKLQLFGTDKLVRDIRFDDLDEYAKEVLRNGLNQLLTSRDTSGRAVIYGVGPDFISYHFPATSIVRAMFYRLMCVVEDDEETQRNGIVFLSTPFDTEASEDGKQPKKKFLLSLEEYHREFLWQGSQLVPACPVRVNAIHMCSNDTSIRPLISMIQMGVGRFARARFRAHFGTRLECQYSLLTFGLPVHVFNLMAIDAGVTSATTDRKTKKDDDNNAQWIHRRQTKEAYQLQSGAAFAGIDLPSNGDILLGRGKVIQAHPGNKKLQDIIGQYRKEYDAAKGRGGKVKVAAQVIEVVHKAGGRFLKRDDGNFLGWWFPVSNDIANEKICNAFRAQRRSGGASNIYQVHVSPGKRFKGQS